MIPPEFSYPPLARLRLMRLLIAATLLLVSFAGCVATGSGECNGSADAQPGTASASGGCGDCGGQAVAGPGYAQVSGSCAGCSGSAAAGPGYAGTTGSCYGCGGSATADGSQAEAKSSGSCAMPATKQVLVYHFAASIMGATPPNPTGAGPAAPELPVARQDAFVVPNGTIALTFNGGMVGGSGDGRIEVYGPMNNLVFSSATAQCAGAPGAPSACTQQGGDDQTRDHAAGAYTVKYFVAGYG